jgi:large subunit ribosomal protein L4e
MKLAVLDTTGKKVADQELPVQFSEPVRTDLIQRAVLAVQTRRKNPYGIKPLAGMNHAARISKRRRDYKGCYGKGISRTPRKTMSRQGAQFNWVGAIAPNTRGGRRAHPPKVGKIVIERINRKENKKAIRSAIAASVVKELVAKRGHKVPDMFPFVIDDKFESLSRTKDVLAAMLSLKLDLEIARCAVVKIRAGRGKMRNRRYIVKKGPLIVVSKPCAVEKAAANILGFDVTNVHSLNAEKLAPGTVPGRLTLWTQSALKELKEKKLFE